jgi:hypothetical protein
MWSKNTSHVDSTEDVHPSTTVSKFRRCVNGAFAILGCVRSVDLWLVADVSEWHIGPIFQNQALLLDRCR